MRLGSAPRQELGYYFTKSSFDPSQIESLHNVEETCLRTPKNPKFDAQIAVELSMSDVEKDCTVTPKFTYHSGAAAGDSISVVGRPFYLDMTSTESTTVARAYVGLDFGTSNSSISFVNHERIQQFECRSQEEAWADLSELASKLPYPIAGPLAVYRKQTDSAKLANAARDFIESSLTVAAYLLFLDMCSQGSRKTTYIFKDFATKRRSAGPLWALVRDLVKRLGKNATFSRPLMELVDPAFYSELDNTVTLFGDQKHGKADDSAAHALRAVQIVSNCCHSAFSRSSFGFFQQVQKQRFGGICEGIFRQAHGQPPFIKRFGYRGTVPFSDQEAFLIDKEKRLAVPLEPLMIWHRCTRHADAEDGHCYFFDAAERDGTYVYKAVGYPCTLKVGVENIEFTGLRQQLNRFVEKDPSIANFEVQLTDEEGN